MNQSLLATPKTQKIIQGENNFPEALIITSEKKLFNFIKNETSLDVVFNENPDINDLNIEEINKKTSIVFVNKYPNDNLRKQILTSERNICIAHIEKIEEKNHIYSRVSAALKTPEPRMETDLNIAEKIVYRSITQTFKSKVLTHLSRPNQKPPSDLIKCTTGIGKSYALRQLAISLVKETGLSVILSTPTHKLAEEHAEAIKKASNNEIDVQVWRGRSSFAEDGTPMCQNKPEAQKISQMGLSPSRYLCDTKCPLKSNCLHVAQRQKAKTDILITTHEMMFQEKPRSIQHGVAAVLIDETPETVMIGGMTATDRLARGLPMSWLLSKQPVSEAVCAGRKRLAEILKEHKEGSFDRKYINKRDESIFSQYLESIENASPKNRTKNNAGESHLKNELKIIKCVLAYIRKQEPGQDQKENENNCSCFLMIDIKKNEPFLTLKAAAKPIISLSHPTLIVSATGSELLLSARWPNIKVMNNINVSSPYAPITHHTGREWSKTSLSEKYNSPGENRHSHKILDGLITHHENRSEKLLVIGQKSTLEAMEAWRIRNGRSLSEKTETAHFNSIAGLDKWGPSGDHEINRLLIIGRPMPDVRSCEMIAQILFGHYATPMPNEADGRTPYYPTTPRPHYLANGSTCLGSGIQHPDPLCEAVRKSICDAEIIQAIGRARGVRRTSANPCEIHLYSTSPIEVSITHNEDWRDRPVTHSDMMETRGMVLENTKHAAALYAKTLWSGMSSPDTAIREQRRASASRLKKRIENPKASFTPCAPETDQNTENAGCEYDMGMGSGVSDHLLESHKGFLTLLSSQNETDKPTGILGEWTPPNNWHEITYRPEGRGCKTARAWVSPDLVKSGAHIELLESACGKKLAAIREENLETQPDAKSCNHEKTNKQQKTEMKKEEKNHKAIQPEEKNVFKSHFFDQNKKEQVKQIFDISHAKKARERMVFQKKSEKTREYCVDD